MAGRGPAPKDTHSRERDTKRRITDQQSVVSYDGEVRGPTLEAATARSDWSEQTRAYWATWRTAPQAQAFENTDWQRLAMLVPLVESLWDPATRPNGRKELLSEIRQNEAALGATIIDRRRLRMKIEEAADAQVLSIVAESDDDLLG